MRYILLALLFFIGLTALLSGLLLLLQPDGSWLGLPLSLLEPTPFRDYTWPGLGLAFGVGAVHLLAFYLEIRGHRFRHNWAMAAGLLLTSWILAQLLLIETLHWLHVVYGGFGLLCILLAWQLKGKWAV
jgi:hypothetical protein